MSHARSHSHKQMIWKDALLPTRLSSETGPAALIGAPQPPDYSSAGSALAEGQNTKAPLATIQGYAAGNKNRAIAGKAVEPEETITHFIWPLGGGYFFFLSLL
ncbi:uncharacterized protein Tco025E_06479, partial [Trypanosoma conorhini]